MDSIVKMGFKQTGPDPQGGDRPQSGTDAFYTSEPGRPPVPQNSRDRAGREKSAGSGAGSAVPAGTDPGMGPHTAGGEVTDLLKSISGEKDRVAAALLKTDKERRAEVEKELRRALNSRYRLIAGYVVATVVACYILVLLVGNVGTVLTAVGRGAAMVGLLLQPLFWGFVLAYVLAPAVEFFEDRLRKIDFFNQKGRNRHTPAVLITCVLALVLVGLLLSIVVSAVSRSLRVASLEDLVAVIQSFVQTLQSFQQTITNRIAALNIDTSEVSSVLQQLGGKVVELTKGLSTSLTGTVSHIGSLLTGALFAVIFAIYFLLDGKGLARYWNRVLLAVGGKKARRDFHILTKDADAVFSGYIRGQLIDALIMAFLVSIALSLIGVKYAVIIGVLSGIGNLIPYLGPVVAYGSTILVCLLTGDLRRLLIAIIILFIVQTVDGNIINPKLLSSSVDVHPMLVIAALIVGGAVGGIVGMLFAVPVAAFLKIQFDKIIDRLLKARDLERAGGRGSGRVKKVPAQRKTSVPEADKKTEKAPASEKPASDSGAGRKTAEKKSPEGLDRKTADREKKAPATEKNAAAAVKKPSVRKKTTSARKAPAAGARKTTSVRKEPAAGARKTTSVRKEPGPASGK